jgi:hypothetical protein
MSADYEFAVDWNADGDFSDTGEDVTGDTLGRSPVTIRYGRDQARSLAPIAPGELRFELNNESRDYSPENSGSPLAGLLLPGRPVRAQAVLGVTTYGLYRGWMDAYDVLPAISDRSVKFTCLDALARLSQVTVFTELYRGLRTGTAIARLLDAAGWDADLRDLDHGATTLPYWWADNTDALSALRAIVDAEGPSALISADADSRIVFRDRHHRITRSASTTVQATWRDDGAEPVFTAPLVYDHGWRDIVNAISFPIPVRSISGTAATVWQVSNTMSLSDGQTLQLTASSGSPFWDAITPEAGTDYTLMSGTVTVTLSRTSGQSTTVRITAVGGPAVVEGMSVRAYPLTTLATVQVEAEDTVSIGRYGRRSWPSGRNPTLASLADAQAIAEVILTQRAERLPTVSVRLANGSDTQLAEILGRDLSDRVRIIDAETGLDGEFYIEQIQHEISNAGHFHIATFGCEKIPVPAANPFTFNLTGAGFDDGTFGDTGLDDPDTVFIFDHATQGQFDVGLLGN